MIIAFMMFVLFVVPPNATHQPPARQAANLRIKI
jgi:hypothetical protein